MREELLTSERIEDNPTKPTGFGASGGLRFLTMMIYLGCLAVNGVIGEWGPHNAKEVSDKYKLYVTPPSFTFLIWAAIYLFMTILMVYVTWKNPWPLRSYLPINVVNIANAVWVGVWSIGTDVSIIACSFIILLVPIGLLSLWVSLYDPKNDSYFYYSSRNIIAFYLGWTIAATIINMGIVLVYTMSFTQKEFTIIFWVLVPLMAIGATVMNTTVQGSNGLKSCVCLWISVLWGLAGALITTLDNKANL